MTSRFRAGIVALAAGLVAAFAAPASASVIYDLTFDNDAGTVVEGAGVLTLNLASVADAYGLNTSDPSIFTSVVTGDINGQGGDSAGHGGFTVTPANLASFYIQTSDNIYDLPLGKIYTLTVAETVPLSNTINPPTSILILDLYTQTWQIHGQWDSWLDGGKLIVSAPLLDAAPATAPLPAGLPLLATGLGALGLLVRHAKRRGFSAAWSGQRSRPLHAGR